MAVVESVPGTSKARFEVPLRVTNPERIPKGRYFDQEFFELERKRLWPHVWQFACRLEEIRDVGDWMEYRNLDLSVLVMRTGPDTVKAFDNACRHRGARLGVGRGHSPSGFVCPFHGWCYDRNGTNTHVYCENLFSEAQLERSEINLRTYQVEIWAGSVFVNQDPAAQPLRDHLGTLPELLDPRNVDDMQTASWRAVEIPCNWKLALEAFFESYHVKRTHPQLLSYGRVDEYGTGSNYGGMSGSNLARPPSTSREEWIENQIGYMTLMTQGTGLVMSKDVDVARRLHGLPLPDDPMERASIWARELNDAITEWGHSVGIKSLPDLNSLPSLPSSVYMAFPNYHIVIAFGNVVLFRVRPLSAERCLFETWRLTHNPDTEQHEPVRDASYIPFDDSLDRDQDEAVTNNTRWGLVMRQDFANLPLQQDGMHRPGFEYMRLSHHVEGRISSLHRTIDAYLSGMPSEITARVASLHAGHADDSVMDFDIEG